MTQKRLNDYRKLRATIAENKRYLAVASNYLYSDARFPAVVAELGEKTSDMEKYCERRYHDVVDFIGNIVISDCFSSAAEQGLNTSYIIKSYYHDAQSWEQVAASCKMEPEQVMSIAKEYIDSNCEKEPAPIISAAPRRVPDARARMHRPGDSLIVDQYLSPIQL